MENVEILKDYMPGAMDRVIELHGMYYHAHWRFGAFFAWTFSGLHAVRHLYEKVWFTLVEQRPGMQWGTEVTEQRFALFLA